MPYIKHRTSSMLILKFCFLILFVFDDGSCTEVTELSSKKDTSLGVVIHLPTLMCHTKYTDYKEVRWYKDYKLLRSGSANVSDHILSIASLLNTHSSPFKQPAELQGYYWCETDYTGPTTVFDYLFTIKEINTFVGWFVSTKDSLESTAGKLTLSEKIEKKKLIYETEMQEELFGFLPKPNTYVTDIKSVENGLQVRFYVYVIPLVQPRRPFADPLIKENHELEHIFQYLNNKSEAMDSFLYSLIVDWTNFRGIDIQNITIRGTLGCYENASPVQAEPPKAVEWPNAYLGEVAIPMESCSSKDGLAVTRVCTGSFYTGAKWGNPSGKCNMPAKIMTSKLRDLAKAYGKNPRPVYIEKLLHLTKHSTRLTVTDLHIVADILTWLSEVKQLKLDEVDGMFSVFDDVVETNKTELEAAKGTIKLTSRLLKVMDNILRMESINNNEVLISKKHFLVASKGTQVDGEVEDHIHGIAILPRNEKKTLVNGSVEFLTSHKFVPTQNSLAFFVLPNNLIIRRENKTDSLDKCKVNVIFFENWILFQNPKGILYRRNYKVLPSPVMDISLTGGPAWNLKEPVQIFFKDTFHRKIENPVCVHYDPRMDNGNGDWTTEGCEFVGLHQGFFECRCHHLSIFAVILSEKPDYSTASFHLGTSVYIACGASIIALSMTILLYLLSKSWRATVDHSVLFWMAVSFLCFILLLFISEMEFLWKPGCVLMGMLIHYTILVTLGWLMVQAIMHRLRFAKKTDIEEVPHFILKSALTTWGFPIIIMIIIWLTKDYTYYDQPNCWKTVADVSVVALIPIVTILLAIVCVNLCAMYAVTCRFKKDFLIGNSTYNDSVVKFRVACSIYLFYVLSWLFGFFALHYRSKELRIFFSISITLTSYYLALFFIFHEVSLWEMCQKWKKSDDPKPIPIAVKYDKNADDKKPEDTEAP